MLKIYNTFTKEKETFEPIKPGEISIYLCGITVYDRCHIGHARTWVSFDVIVRFLRAMGWKVTYVRNITDIDDKIIKRANEENVSIQDLTDRMIAFMDEDAEKLGTLAPDQEPRATAHMDTIIEMIQRLVEKKSAYIADNGDVYFDVSSYQAYGELAKKDLEDLQAGSRVDIVDAKHNPLDFVLWKQAKENEPYWDSPFGKGRPGWHIECSAMSTQCLGNHFDIHGGGNDLIFPHHENERAQSEAATGEKFVNTWMHVGFVNVNKEKMSKSLGNFFTIEEVLKVYDPEVVRYLLLASHYRSPINYSDEQLNAAKSSLTTLYTALNGRHLKQVSPHDMQDNDFFKRFVAAMEDDFNTPIALAQLFDLAHEVNRVAKENADKADELASLLYSLGHMIGVCQTNPVTFLQGGQADDVQEIENLIAKRNQARSDKNWAEADKLRDKLTEMGVVIEDGAKGTGWRRG